MQNKLGMLIRMYGEACEVWGIYSDLMHNSPKRIEAVKRVDRLWKEIERHMPDIAPKHIDLTNGNEDGEIAQRIYRDLVERKWAELHRDSRDVLSLIATD